MPTFEYIRDEQGREILVDVSESTPEEIQDPDKVQPVGGNVISSAVSSIKNEVVLFVDTTGFNLGNSGTVISSGNFTGLNKITLGSVASLGSICLFTGDDNLMTFNAPAIGAVQTYTLPAADGTPGDQLTTDGSGILSWSLAAAGMVDTALDFTIDDRITTTDFSSGVKNIKQSSVVLDSSNNLSTINQLTINKSLIIDTQDIFNNNKYGYNVLSSLTTGTANCGIGDLSLVNLQDGNNNVALGIQALNSVVSGSSNTGVGISSLGSCTGSSNTGLGAVSGSTNLAGSRNVYIGERAGQTNATGNDSTYVGYRSGDFASGSNNSVLGASGLFNVDTGTDNISIGKDSSSAYTGAESNNIIIGHAGVLADSGQVRIGTSGTHTACNIPMPLTVSGLTIGSNPAVATSSAPVVDLSIPVYDSTSGSLIKETGVLIDASDNISGVNDLTAVNNITASGLLVSSSLDINFTAIEDDSRAVQINADAAGFANVESVGIIYETGAINAGDVEAGVLVGIDQSASTGGRVLGVGVVATSTGSSTVDALGVGSGVNPIIQQSGTFDDADSILVNAVNELTDLSQGGGGNVSVFVADNDTITVGHAAQYAEIEFIVDTGSSGGGVAPTFEYSTGVGSWVFFSPTDGTSGFRNSGNVIWELDDIPGWLVGLASEFLIRITRTRNTLFTTPILDLIQLAGTTEYSWNKDGALNVSSISAAGLPGVFCSSAPVVDEAICLWDGTDGSNINESSATINSGGNMFLPGTLSLTGGGNLSITESGGGGFSSAWRAPSSTTAGRSWQMPNTYSVGNEACIKYSSIGSFRGWFEFPASSTTNAIPKWGDATSDSFLNSGLIIDGSNNLDVPGQITTGADIIIDTIDGSTNTRYGFDTLTSVAGIGNTVVGSEAGTGIINNNNTLIGKWCGENAIGSSQTCIGTQAGRNMGTATNCVYAGILSGASITGNQNSCCGSATLGLASGTANNCSVLGYSALSSGTNCSFIVAIGENAGDNYTTESNNVCIANTGVAADSGMIRIGTDGTHTSTTFPNQIRMEDNSNYTGFRTSTIQASSYTYEMPFNQVSDGQVRTITTRNGFLSENSTPPYPAGYINGGRIAWSSNFVILIVNTFCRDDTDVFNLTKSSGSVNINTVGVGGLQTGSSESVSTWYGVYIIGDTSLSNSTEYLLIPDGTAFSQTGYDVKRRVGWVRNNGVSNFYNFYVPDSEGASRFMLWDESETVLEVLTNGAATVYTDVDISEFIPPGIHLAWCNTNHIASGDQDFATFHEGESSLDGLSPVSNPRAQRCFGGSSTGSAGGSCFFFIPTSINQIVAYGNSSGSEQTDLWVLGYIDNL